MLRPNVLLCLQLSAHPPPSNQASFACTWPSMTAIPTRSATQNAQDLKAVAVPIPAQPAQSLGFLAFIFLKGV